MKPILDFIKQLGPIKLGIIGAVAALTAILLIALSMSGGGSKNMQLLYSNLMPETSNSIVVYLEEQRIPYELRAGGTQIFIDESKIDRVRLQLAGMGLTSQATEVGFEIFDKNDALGTSQFVNNINYLRALEGELGRSIATIAGIENARVHVVLPKRELFSREQKPPTASVVTTLKQGKKLSKEEIQSIRQLVATAVPGLEVSKITIIDNNGKLLARGSSDENDVGEAANEADEFRLRYEIRLREKLEELLGRTVGEQNVRVQVTADIDFDRIVRRSERYDPEGQVARSTQTLDENERSREREMDTNVTVQNNLPDPDPNAAGVLSESERSKSEETVNYEISKEEINHVQEIGTVNKISVAVLVNGRIQLNEDGTLQYVERSEQELEQLARLTKSAIGFDAKRGDTIEVINMPFSETLEQLKPIGTLDWLKEDFHNILQTAILGIVAILAILLVIRPLVNRAIETTTFTETEPDNVETLLPDGTVVAGQLTDQRGGGGEGGAAGGVGEDDDDDEMIDIAGIEGGIKSSSMRRITALIERNPEDALNVLRMWMSNQE